MALFCKALALGLSLALAACAMPDTVQTKAGGPNGLMAWPDLLERARPSPSTTISYGADPLQVVDLYLPEGQGPHPTVIMVHGGCWQTEIADRKIMSWIADDLTRHGIAVWNVDYRGVDRPGGGYPGTFQDAAAAADALRDHAARYRLDISRLVATGHSAGGHLALWLAARPRLPEGSPLRTADPIPIHEVVSLGGLPDLEEAARPPGSGCGTEVIERISGGRFAETSVPRLAPLGIKQVLINGNQDRIIPTAYAEGYARPMRAAGDDVRVRMIDRTGHVELIAPETAAWAAAVAEIRRALQVRHPGEGRNLGTRRPGGSPRDPGLRRGDEDVGG
jgi:acetyl esterase/lipase